MSSSSSPVATALNSNKHNDESELSEPTLSLSSTAPTAAAATASNVSSQAQRVNLSVREKIWSGSVPCLFSMESNEIMLSSLHKQPISIFLLLPRISYLPLVTQRVHSHFMHYAPALSDGMWFEYTDSANKRHALKWNYPIGVLYDLYHHDEHHDRNSEQSAVWNLTVHFQSYPADEVIMKCDNIETVKQSFFNYLKQCVFLSHNNVAAVSALSKSDQDTLWSGVHKADYNLYFPVYHSIFGKHQKLIRYPFRILLRGFNEQVDLVPIQRPILCNHSHDDADGDGDGRTLRECLQQIIPGVMQMYDKQQLQQQSEIGIIVQGMRVALDTPMIWLVRHATYADCFLYVVIVKK